MTSLAGLAAVAMTYNIEPEEALVMASNAIKATDNEHDAVLDVVNRAMRATSATSWGSKFV